MREMKRPAAAWAAVTASGVLVFAATVFLTAAAITLPAVGAKADGTNDDAQTQPLVTLDLRDARLESAVAALGQQSRGTQIVTVSDPGKSFGTVNVRCVDQPLDKVLRMIARSAGATLSQDDGIYYFRPRGANDPDPDDIARAAAAPTAVVADTSLAPRQYVRIYVTYMKPSDIVRVLHDPNALAMEEDDLAQRQAASPTPANGVVRDSLPQYDPNHTPFNPAPQNKLNPFGDTGTAGQNDPAFAAQGQQGIPGGPGFGGPGGPGGARGAAGANLTPAGIDNIISNDADNALIVKGDAAGIEELRQIVRLLDVAPKQVLIRAEFVSVQLNDADSFGISWQMQLAPNIDVQTAAFGTGNTVAMTYASGNAVANLEATLTKAKTNVLEAPIISTTNNRPASISVGQEVPISQSISNITPQGTQITTTSVTYIPVENSLNITPHINGDNSVSLFVAPQLQTEGTSQIPGYPLISNQSLTTYRRIANGQTMVLGGFITKQDNRSTEDVPYLSQLPIVGNLFKSYDHSIDNSEVLVFLTPQIIEDRPQGSIGTAGSNPPATP